MNKNFFDCLFFVYFFHGILEKNTPTQKKFNSYTGTIKKVNEQNISPTWLSLNSKTTIEKEGQYSKVNASIRIKKR